MENATLYPQLVGGDLASVDHSADLAVPPEQVLKLVLETLDDAKSENTVTIDIHDKTSIGDYMVVSSGRSQRHVGAVADHLVKALKGLGRSVRVEGMPHCDWVLVDAGDVIAHIFRPEVRTFYNLEKMWSADLAPERLVS